MFASLGVHMDPAFAYAMDRSDFQCIRPWYDPKTRTLQLSKAECKLRQSEWNASVEEYIQTGRDQRERLAIERESMACWRGGAKLGSLFWGKKPKTYLECVLRIFSRLNGFSVFVSQKTCSHPKMMGPGALTARGTPSA